MVGALIMFNLWKTLLGRNKKKKTEAELFFEFLRTAKEKMTNEIDKAMFRYLEEIYKMAVSSQKKIENKKPELKTWISRDLEIDQEALRKKEEEENKLPHPIEK